MVTQTTICVNSELVHNINNLINIQSTELWNFFPPNELGNLVLGASESIFETRGGCRGVKGWSTHFVRPVCGRSALVEGNAHGPPGRRGALGDGHGWPWGYRSPHNCLHYLTETTGCSNIGLHLRTLYPCIEPRRVSFYCFLVFASKGILMLLSSFLSCQSLCIQ